MNPIALVNFRFPKIFRIPGGPAQDRFAAASNFRRSLMKVEAATKAKPGSIILSGAAAPTKTGRIQENPRPGLL
jgi:hypothetical protein